MSRLLNVGFGNVVNTDKIVAIVSTDAAPIKRMLQSAREQGTLIDASCGRKTKSLILTTSDYVVASAMQPETLMQRFHADQAGGGGNEE